MEPWMVYVIEPGEVAPRCSPAATREVHVAPCDEDGVLLDNHRLAIACPCRPTLVREGPLDDPVIGHREPRHPGSNTVMDA